MLVSRMFKSSLKFSFSTITSKTNIYYKITGMKNMHDKNKSQGEKISMMFSLSDNESNVSHLCETLNVFRRNNMNISYINSKPSICTYNVSKRINYFIDIDKPKNEGDLLSSVNELKNRVENLELIGPEEIPWFPKSLDDINLIGKKIIGAEELGIDSENPEVNDQAYLYRRNQISEIFKDVQIKQQYPHVKYNKEENELWNKLLDKLRPLHKQYACQEFNENFNQFISNLCSRGKEIPQMYEINDYLSKSTGVIYRQTDGLLSQREYLNSLAFKVFSSTAFVRHYSSLFFSTEPDVLHDYIGHAVLFTNKDFCDFNQEIGLSSLGASDDDIKKLGTIYWYTIEVGLCLEKGKRKLYGGALLTSPLELEWAMSDKPNIRNFDLNIIPSFPTKYIDLQENYFIAPSFKEMKKEVRKYADTFKRSFNVSYNIDTKTVVIDRKVNIKKLNSS